MSEYERFIALLRMPNGDRACLLTFGLTVLVDLTVAVDTALHLLRYCSWRAWPKRSKSIPADDRTVISTTRMFTNAIRCPRASKSSASPAHSLGSQETDTLRRVGRKSPKVIILRMRLVPLLDARGVHALEEFLERAYRRSEGCSLGVPDAANGDAGTCSTGEPLRQGFPCRRLCRAVSGSRIAGITA